MSAPLKERYTRACALQRRGRQQGADESVLLASWGIAALATCEQAALSSPAASGGVFRRASIGCLLLQKGLRGQSGAARRGHNTDAIPAWPATPPPAARRGRLQACLNRPIVIAEGTQEGHRKPQGENTMRIKSLLRQRLPPPVRQDRAIAGD